jgi:hypothetical protein
MKKILTILLVCCLSLFVLSACGNDNSSQRDEPLYGQNIENNTNDSVDDIIDSNTNTIPGQNENNNIFVGDSDDVLNQEVENNQSVVNEMKISVENFTFTAQLEENDTAKGLINLLPMTINMSAMTHEKYYNLPTILPTDVKNVGKIEAGDIMLWGNNCLVIFYESFSTTYSYTRIGKIKDITNLISALGQGSITVTLSV